jgi:outer membrane protein OmpA-like peptidoglycan-associated protein
VASRLQYGHSSAKLLFQKAYFPIFYWGNDSEKLMKLKLGAASLLALTLFVVPVMPGLSSFAVAQSADQPAVDTAATAVPDNIMALLADARAATELSDDELKARLKIARKASKDESLPEDVRGQLKDIAAASAAELDARAQAQEPAKVEEPKPAEVAPAPVAPQAEQPVAPVQEQKQPEQPAAPVIPDDVSNLLNDGRALADLSADELKQRAKAARHFAKDESLPQDLRDKLNGLAQDARIEIAKRDQPAQVEPAPAPAQPEPPKQEQAVEPAPAPVEPPKQEQAVEPAPAPVEPAPAIVQEVAPPKAPEPAPVIVQDTPAAAVAVVDAPPPPPAAAAKVDVQALDSNAGDPASEKQARAYLDDATDLTTLSDDDLRNRLDAIRDVMASNELSRDTERAVRKKLKGEREILRQRLTAQEAVVVAKEVAAAPPPPPAALPAAISAVALPPAPPPPPPLPPIAAGTVVNNVVVNNTTINNTMVITNVTPAPVVLRDPRPPERLQVSELQRRLQVYNDAQFDEDYDQANRDYWRQSMARDREILRRRMLADRQRREAQLTLEASNDNLDISISLNFSNDRPPPPRYVFAAEVDDQQLEEVLVAPPRKSFKQRYNLEEISVQPQLRESVSRIEIDTIRFGSNQAFVREEQLDSLDGIAAIIERIVKKYPNEVFLIEGHTDAPGSSGYNMRLSKLRAEAIKKALVSYYVIPARNLRTVGLGERFLKIPTADAEPENRRVSISRITQLLGQN